MSRFVVLFGVLLAGMLALPAPSVATDTITLMDEAYVRGPKVFLGDVAHIEGENAEFLAVIEVAPAALPGSARRLSAALLLSRLKDAGVDIRDLDVKGAHRVLATTRHLEITRGMMSEALRRFVQAEMPWNPRQCVIDIIPPPRDYVVPDGEVEFSWRPNPQYNYLGMGVFRGDVLVDGKVERTFSAKARIEAYEDVVVSGRDISRGDILSPKNLRFEKRPLSTLDSGAFFSIEEVTGHLAKSSIFSGQVVTARKVMAPRLIKRNQIVLVETKLGSLRVTVRAQALSDASEGDVVACKSLKSKDQVLGVVRKDGVVVVE